MIRARMSFVYDDGGRRFSGFRGTAGDCVCRSIAIASGLPYLIVYAGLAAECKRERRGARKRGFSTPRSGIYKRTIERYLTGLGWKFTALVTIGSGCKVHMAAGELPAGRLIVSLSKHYSAVINGTIHDAENPDRNGTRCVYGYWTGPEFLTR